MNKTILPALMIAAVSIGMPAQAALTPGANELLVQGHRNLDDNQRLVSYADLNLRNEAGQQALQQRVGMAIADLCDASRFSAADPAGSLKCAKAAWAEMQPQLAQLSNR
nr:UrcA family protein [uncultured Sphingomonas sp.]